MTYFYVVKHINNSVEEVEEEEKLIKIIKYKVKQLM